MTDRAAEEGLAKFPWSDTARRERGAQDRPSASRLDPADGETSARRPVVRGIAARRSRSGGP